MYGFPHESALIQKHQRGDILLDTNLLLLYLIGNLRATAIKTFPHTKQYAAEDYSLLAKVVGLFRAVVTTPNILTEVSNLSGKLNEADLRAFREGFKGAIEILVERYCPSGLAAQSPAFSKFGLTDAGIACLCERDILVITDDLPLQQWLASKQIDAVNFNHIRRSFWSAPG
jgi:hypothetical protein